MNGLSYTNGKILFRTVRAALDELRIPVRENDFLSLLVWYDTIKEIDYFSRLMPWQVVNRLPNINVICRKAPFVRCIHRIMIFFPHLFTFLPRSFILPLHKSQFQKALYNTTKTYIVKPDGGALGAGIEIIPPGTPFDLPKKLCVAQEYIESYLLDGYKFDFRIYCLVVSGKKPKIYVYRDGIARFCSHPASDGDKYSQLTNTAVNITNPDVVASSITHLVSDVMKKMEKNGVDVKTVWKEIDKAIALTVLSCYGIVDAGVAAKAAPCGYSRSFQLLGFDVLLDRNAKPWILEVNYRPSLEFDTLEERALKVKMISETIKIAAPYGEIEQTVRSRKKPWTLNAFRQHLDRNPAVVERMRSSRKQAVSESAFEKVFPSKDPEKVEWYDVLKAGSQMPTDIGTGYQLPRIVDSIPMVKDKAQPSHSVSHLPPLHRSRK